MVWVLFLSQLAILTIIVLPLFLLFPPNNPKNLFLQATVLSYIFADMKPERQLINLVNSNTNMKSKQTNRTQKAILINNLYSGAEA